VTTPLQITRYDRLARRLMGLVGEGSIVTSVLPDVFPVIDVEDMQTDGWVLAGWNLCFGFESILDAVLSVEVALENLVGSNMLVVIEKIDVSSTGNSLMAFGTNTAGTVLTGTSNNFHQTRDTRVPGTRRPVTTVTEGTAIPFSPFGRIRCPANQAVQIEAPKGVYVLAPGQMFVVQNTQANVQTDVTYWWRERLIEPSETLG